MMERACIAVSSQSAYRTFGQYRLCDLLPHCCAPRLDHGPSLSAVSLIVSYDFKSFPTVSSEHN